MKRVLLLKLIHFKTTTGFSWFTLSFNSLLLKMAHLSPFVDDLPIKMVIFRYVFHYQRVSQLYPTISDYVRWFTHEQYGHVS